MNQQKNQNVPIADTKPVRNWRDELTVDELRTIERAIEHETFWAGVPNNSPLMLVAKLARLLDEKKD